MSYTDVPRYVWATPCLTYTEQRPGLTQHRGGCLHHKTTGPWRDTTDQAQADCTAHMRAVLADEQAQLPGVD